MTHTVFALTSKGRSARSGAQGVLPADMQHLLAQIDGRRTRAELLSGLGRSATAAGGLRWLVHAGFIAPVIDAAEAASMAKEPAATRPRQAPPVHTGQAARYLMLSSFLTEAVREHLGLRGLRLQLRIERASGTADLIELLPRLAESIAGAAGQDAALEFQATARALLSQA